MANKVGYISVKIGRPETARWIPEYGLLELRRSLRRSFLKSRRRTSEVLTKATVEGSGVPIFQLDPELRVTIEIRGQLTDGRQFRTYAFETLVLEPSNEFENDRSEGFEVP